MRSLWHFSLMTLLGLCGALCGVILLIYMLFVTDPMEQQIRHWQYETQQLQLKTETLQQRMAKEQAETPSPILEESIRIAPQSIPFSASLMMTWITQSPLQLIDFTPRLSSSDRTSALEMTLTGSFGDLHHFLSQLNPFYDLQIDPLRLETKAEWLAMTVGLVAEVSDEP